MKDLSKCPNCGGEMKFHPIYYYRQPDLVGWKGWVEDKEKNCVGFISLEDEFIPNDSETIKKFVREKNG